MASIASPLDHFNRFQQKQAIEAQFTEDIRHVIHGGYGNGSSTRGDSIGASSRQRGMRARSPGLAAGAALALSGAPAGPDPHAVARRLKEQGRGSGCPFDDHSAFEQHEAVGLGGLLTNSAATSEPQPPTPSQHREAFEAARSVGRRNKDVQQKIGAAAPFDAPETSMPTSTYSAVSGQVAAGGAPAGAAAAGGRSSSAAIGDHTHNYADARREAANHKTRMVNSSENIISGGYLQGESRVAAPVGRSAHRPPQPERLLPQAQLKVQMDGMGRPSQERAAFLNAKVMNEACRERNVNSLWHLG